MLMGDPKLQGRQRAPQNPLSPLSFLRQAAGTDPDGDAIVFGADRRSWAEVYARCFAFAGGLHARGIGRGDTVAVLSGNIPEMFEAQFSVPMSGAVLCALNPRLEADVLAKMLADCGASAVIVDPSYVPLLGQIITKIKHPRFFVVEIATAQSGDWPSVDAVTYDAFLDEANPDFIWTQPVEETDPIAICFSANAQGAYGVVHDHRAAFLNAQSLLRLWDLPQGAVALGLLPLYRASGWGLAWALAAAGGTFVCTRDDAPERLFGLIAKEKVSHVCAISEVFQGLAQVSNSFSARMTHPVLGLSAGAVLPTDVVATLEEKGISLIQALGRAETQGPVIVFGARGGCGTGRVHVPEMHGDMETITRRCTQLARPAPGVEALRVANPFTHHSVPSDGETVGKIHVRGNGVMQEYFLDPRATDSVFSDGWLVLDLWAVRHGDGSLEMRASKDDVVETRGEFVNLRDVEAVLEDHRKVRAAAVVLCQGASVGQVPCAFVELRKAGRVSRKQLVSHCKEQLADFKVPRTVIFGTLPRRSDGEIDRELLWQRAQAL